MTFDDKSPPELELIDGSRPLRHTFSTWLHFVLTLIFTLLKLPFHLTWHYVLCRRRSPLVSIGRHPLAQISIVLTKWSFGNTFLPPSRLLYAAQLFLRNDPWIERIELESGLRAVWVRPPDTERSRDDVVLYWIHGGAFTYDILGANMRFYKQLARQVNEDPARPLQFSIFLLDYHLAPEKMYPSQLIELDAGYRHLTRTLGLDPAKICLGGDSAGGNLVVSFLLHLAKSNPDLPIDSDPLPRPGSVLLLSPFLSLVPLPSRPSRVSTLHSSVDCIETPSVTVGAYHYLNLTPPFNAGPSWNPLRWISLVEPEMPRLGLEMVDPRFRNPYVNPDSEVLREQHWDWYASALPQNVCIVYGGMEVLVDDIKAFVAALRRVGLDPTEVLEPYKTHDWPMFDYSIPFCSRNVAGGKGSKNPKHGLEKMAQFLRDAHTEQGSVSFTK
ncbi:alpha/beta hydrolase [Sporobolomyces koalae]|uniref:alpha/beta hydrolase n=1 Tax=Sporobolomyces koalae TaxID=500713 RepID=UPI003170724D